MLILNNGQLIAKTLWREIVSIYDGLVFWRYLAGIWLPGCLAYVNYCYKYGFSVRFFLLFVCARDGAVLCMFFVARTTTETKTIYLVHELSEESLDKAFDCFCRDDEFPWHGEMLDSIKAFCDIFAVKLIDYSFGGGESHREYIKTDATNANFRGLRFRKFNFEQNLTGICLDRQLLGDFKKNWDKSHCPFVAFLSTLEDYIYYCNIEFEHYYSMDNFLEMASENAWEFTENGAFF